MRKLSGAVGWAVVLYVCAASLSHLYIAGYGSLEPRLMRAVHLFLLLSLTSLLYPATRLSPQDRSSFLDSLAAGSAGAACGYIVWHAKCLNFRPAAVLLVFPAGGLELLGLGLAGGTFAWARSPRSAS